MPIIPPTNITPVAYANGFNPHRKLIHAFGIAPHRYNNAKVGNVRAIPAAVHTHTSSNFFEAHSAALLAFLLTASILRPGPDLL